MRTLLHSNQRWVQLWHFVKFESIALCEFSGDICRSICNICLSWRPSLFVSRGAGYLLWDSTKALDVQERDLSSYDDYTRGRCRDHKTFVKSKLLFAGVYWNARTALQQISPAVYPGEQSLAKRLWAFFCIIFGSIFDTFRISLCFILRYLPNTDTPMCDPWAAVQFNKHQCKWDVMWKVESSVFVYSSSPWGNMQTLPSKLWGGKKEFWRKYFYLECSSTIPRLNF